MKKDKVLWADDEIDLLKPHMMFLQEKGYEVTPVVSGQDAIDCCREQSFDIIFLDENMPGLTGLETLSQIKEIAPNAGCFHSAPCRCIRSPVRRNPYGGAICPSWIYSRTSRYSAGA